MKKIIILILSLTVCLSVCSAFAVNFCPNCGENMQQNWNVCPYCGYSLGIGPNPDPEPVSQKTWPTIQTARIETYPSPKEGSDQILARSGPGGQYWREGYIKADIIRHMYIWFEEDGFYMCEIYDADTGWRAAYVLADRTTQGGASSSLSKRFDPVPARITKSTTVYLGPGTKYRPIDSRVMMTGSTTVNSGTDTMVYFEKDGWVLCDIGVYTNDANVNTARAWIPADAVTAK